MSDVVCFRCGMELEYVKEWGRYIHKNGGAIMQFCTDCKREFTKERPVRACPYCGSLSLVDNHIAMPKYNNQVIIK